MMDAPFLCEPLWNLVGLRCVVLRFKLRNCGGDVGLTANIFLWAKEAWVSITALGEQIGDVLSLPRISSLGKNNTKYDVWKQHVNRFLKFAAKAYMFFFYGLHSRTNLVTD